MRETREVSAICSLSNILRWAPSIIFRFLGTAIALFLFSRFRFTRPMRFTSPVNVFDSDPARLAPLWSLPWASLRKLSPTRIFPLSVIFVEIPKRLSGSSVLKVIFMSPTLEVSVPFVISPFIGELDIIPAFPRMSVCLFKSTTLRLSFFENLSPLIYLERDRITRSVFINSAFVFESQRDSFKSFSQLL